jgi:hypothetical protein
VSLVVTASCDGSWDEGRMPCRGAISAHHDVPLMDELRAKAQAAGWALTVDGDFCPAHARTQEDA